MRALVITMIAMMVGLIASAQSDVKVSAFTKQAHLLTSDAKLPTLNITLSGMSVSWKKVSGSIAYARNYTLEKNGVAVGVSYTLVAKPLGKGFGVGVKAIANGAYLAPGETKTVSFATAGLGIGVKKQLHDRVSASVAIPVTYKVVMIEGLDPIHTFESGPVLGLSIGLTK